ncbi:magnesium transporter CorA family protein [Actinomadura latina]|uniref:Magnesium transporter CorA family protein n=1 Tax=Actinomadura latina TaxID=163603 RepID=A0A846Z234_9ACTN|nr:magnesium transporter CorA family protein [Actinomadura latina]NKZ07340.1 magnesium transporter CorA family protein [Actinomadura latina]
MGSDPPGTPPPRTRAWRGGSVEAEDFPVAEVSDYLERPDVVVWVDLCAPHHEDLRIISDELGLDPVAVEDAVSRHERTKLDRYHGYAFLNVYIPHVDGGAMVMHELSAFIAERVLVTVRQEHGFDADALIDRWDQSADPGYDKPTTAFLVHGMLDLVVDLQLAAVQALDDEADEVEDLVFGDEFPVKEIQHRSYRLRKDLAKLRRVALPMREVLNTLLRRDVGLVPPPLVPYFQDVYDHTLRIGEWTDALRDLVADLLDTRLALQSNRMNEVMKKVTSWAAIIAVPTAVTGFYGMNVPYPGFSRHDGFIASVIIIVLCSTTLYVIFKVRDWL